MDRLLLIVSLMLSITTITAEVSMPPHIEMKEPDIIFKGGDKAQFQLICKANGVPRPEVEWIKTTGSVMADKNENGILFFDGFARKQAGKYQCKASNKYGTVVSNYVNLKYAFIGAYETPTDAHLTPKNVQEGDSLKVPCRKEPGVFSVPDPDWSWVTQNTLEAISAVQKKINLDSRVSVDKDGNLHFAYVLQTDNQGGWFYLCEAWNANLGLKKAGSPSRINVLKRAEGSRPRSKPVMSYTNAQAGTNKVKVIEGEILNLYCIFKGYPDITVSWTKAGNLPASTKSNGGTKLTVEDVKNTDLYNGIYICQGTNSEGTTEQRYDVEVLVKPKFTEGPKMVQNTNVTVGGDVEFVCDVEAKPSATVKWRVNNIPVADGDQSEPRRTISGNRFKLINLHKGDETTGSDLQVVTCEASNYDSGEEIATRFISGYINVVLPLAMASGPEDYVINSMKDEIVLQCLTESDASKPPMIAWFRDGKRLKHTPDKLIYQPDNSLKIIADEFKTVGDITGVYMCQASTIAPDQMVTAACNVTADAAGIVAPITTAAINLWWIAIIVVIVLILFIIVLICCCIKRNRGESYPVDEVERKMGNDPEKDLKESGFHDYQRQEKDPMGGSRASLDGSIKPLDSDDDDNDSLAEYGDMDMGKFNEDGSFIGLYGTDKKKKDAPPPYSRNDSSV